MNHIPVIGLMLGDMTGIGPEICAKVMASGKLRNVARIVVTKSFQVGVAFLLRVSNNAQVIAP